MSGFEFNVAKNLAGNVGVIKGIFAVSRAGTQILDSIRECRDFLDDQGKQREKVIPVILDENEGDGFINHILPRFPDIFAGYVTFGTDKDWSLGIMGSKVPIRTHSEIIPTEMGRTNPNFLAAMLDFPERDTDITPEIWQKISPLTNLHQKFAQVLIEDSTCIIECTE